MRSLFCLVILMSTVGCTSLSLQPGSGFNYQTHQLTRPDGSDITYGLHHRSASDQRGIVVVIQGTGCASAMESQSLKNLSWMAPSSSVLVLEKYGITKDNAVNGGITAGCPDTFFENYTPDQSVDDYEQVLSHLKDNAAWWNGDLVLAGTSYGGVEAAFTALRVPETDRLVMISSGPGNFRDAAKHSISSYAQASGGNIVQIAFFLRDLDTILDEIQANPDKSPRNRIGGHSYKFWASALAKNTRDAMTQLEIPMLIIQGSEDQLIDVEETRQVVDDFNAKTDKCNLTYMEIDGLDHSLIDGNGVNRSNEIAARIQRWINSNTGADGCAIS